MSAGSQQEQGRAAGVEACVRAVAQPAARWPGGSTRLGKALLLGAVAGEVAAFCFLSLSFRHLRNGPDAAACKFSGLENGRSVCCYFGWMFTSFSGDVQADQVL